MPLDDMVDLVQGAFWELLLNFLRGGHGWQYGMVKSVASEQHCCLSVERPWDSSL